MRRGERESGIRRYDTGTGEWVTAHPMGFADGIDFEVSGRKPYIWTAWRGSEFLGSGSARTRVGLWWDLWWSRHCFRRQQRRRERR